MNHKYKNLLSNVSLFTISNLGSKVLTVLLVPLYTSVLSTEEYGIVDLIISTISLLLPILTCSTAEGVLRFSFTNDNYARDSLTISFVYSIFGTIVCFFLYPIVSRFNVSIGKYWNYAVALFFLMAIRDSYSSYIKGVDRTKIFAIQGVIFTFVYLSLNILLLLFLNWGVSGYFISLIGANLISIIYMFLFERHWIYEKIKWNSKLNSEMLRYCVPIIVSTVAWWMNTSVDKYMITEMISVSENGIYSMGHKIPTLITTITGVFSQAWLLSTISAEENDSEDEKQCFYSNIFEIYMIFCVSLSFFVVLFCKPLSRFMFNNEFFGAWKYVPLLTISALFSGYAGFWASFFRASKKTNILLHSTIISAVINIALNSVLLRLCGTIGAAIATSISFFVMWIIRVFAIRCTVKIKWISFSIVHVLLMGVVLFSMIESWIIYPLFLVFVAVIFSVYKDKVLKICFMVKKYLRKGDK